MNNKNGNKNDWLVVGLGNPGSQYEGTRHNIGKEVIDELARRNKLTFKLDKKLGAEIAIISEPGRGLKIFLVKPISYMNLSGAPTKAVANYYNIPPDHIIAVHDEIDIDFESVKLKKSGSEGGHNGLRDISKVFGTKDYYRVRVGVGRPRSDNTTDFVLSGFSSTEKKELPFLIDKAADVVQDIVSLGLTAAQNKHYSK